MKSLLVVLLALCFTWGCQSSKNLFVPPPFPTPNDFHGVLALCDRHGNVATGFALIRNGKQYIVTARHFAGYMSKRDSVGVFVNSQWRMIRTRLVGHGVGDIDITVFSFFTPFLEHAAGFTPLMSDADTVRLGCDIWFLGFPHGYMRLDPEHSYPFPLVKHAYLSDWNVNPRIYWLDGYANPGFSGGPVFARTITGELRLIGVASSILTENLGIDSTSSDSPANSGIFLAYSARYAEMLIDQNPIGVPIQ